MTDRIAIGLSAYGPQPPNWWVPFATLTANLQHYDIELVSLLVAQSSTIDGNRNNVVDNFLTRNVDWLLWMDTDNPMPIAGIRRLLDVQKSLVTGVYYIKAEPYTPVVYRKNAQGLYNPIHDWQRGEILEVDMAGMGCCLTHRSVYEDMRENMVPLLLWDGSRWMAHKSEIKGSLKAKRVKSGPRIVDGFLSVQAFPNDPPGKHFPWFYFSGTKGEDVFFFENAAKCGHQLFCDTSVEVPHLMGTEVTGEDYRKFVKAAREQQDNGGEIETMEVDL